MEDTVVTARQQDRGASVPADEVRHYLHPWGLAAGRGPETSCVSDLLLIGRGLFIQEDKTENQHAASLFAPGNHEKQLLAQLGTKPPSPDDRLLTWANNPLSKQLLTHQDLNIQDWCPPGLNDYIFELGGVLPALTDRP